MSNRPDSSTPKSRARRRFLKWAVGAAAISSGVVGYEGRVDANALTVTARDVHLAGWPGSASGMRVGQLSDLHCDNPHAVTRTVRAVEMMLAQKPDIVFLTGDYITYKPQRWAAPAIEALRPLTQAPLGCCAVLGNHDWWCGGGLILARKLHQAGITVLRNQSVPFPAVDGAWIVGLDDVCVDKQDAGAALNGVPADSCKILLVHEPDYADEAPAGFALQLSGHSHAGQIRLPGLPPLHCPKYGRHYPEGLQQGPNHLVYTTRGVGMIGPQIRLFCPPEVTLLRLFPKP